MGTDDEDEDDDDDATFALDDAEDEDAAMLDAAAARCASMNPRLTPYSHPGLASRKQVCHRLT